MRSSSNSGSKTGKTDCSQTNDRERNSGYSRNILYVVGIGPGSLDHMSKRACEVLDLVDTVAGYTTYIDLIYPLIKNKNIISTPMTKEVKRVEAAVDAACNGKSCAIISSGDPGIYAMAGLVFEVCQTKNITVIPPGHANNTPASNKSSLAVEVVPGIPALCSGAALLGAPLSHDFAVISLSDLLTPWDLIEQRIEAAAKADFVIVIYNPKSKKRNQHLEKAQKIILRYRDKNTPTGIVTGAMRKNQNVRIITLESLHLASVDMQTTVFIGSKASKVYLDYMVTPRGYSKKYTFDSKKH